MVLSKGSNNSEPKIIFLDFFIDFCQFFWCQKFKNLQTILTRKINFKIFFLNFLLFFVVLSKGSNNSEPKIIFLDFLSIFVNFFGVKNSKNLQTILTRKINFLIFFSRFLSFFGVFQKLAHYSFQTILKFGSLFGSNNVELKIIFLDFFSIFLSFFWCILKVSSLFASDNSEPKKIIEFFFLIFCQFF